MSRLLNSQTRPEPLEMARRISVDFHDADIKTVLLAFSELSGISIIASKNVNGRITARISHMPWDQALYSLLETNGLAVRETNGMLTVDTIENIRENEKLEDLESQDIQAEFPEKCRNCAHTLGTCFPSAENFRPMKAQMRLWLSISRTGSKKSAKCLPSLISRLVRWKLPCSSAM